MKDHLIIRKILSFFMAITLIIGCFPGSTLDAQAARKPSLSAKKITIAKGMSYKLKVKNKRSSVKWSSSNKKVAKVSKTGKVTGVKNGKATINLE